MWWVGVGWIWLRRWDKERGIFGGDGGEGGAKMGVKG